SRRHRHERAAGQHGSIRRADSTSALLTAAAGSGKEVAGHTKCYAAKANSLLLHCNRIQPARVLTMRCPSLAGVYHQHARGGVDALGQFLPENFAQLRRRLIQRLLDEAERGIEWTVEGHG